LATEHRALITWSPEQVAQGLPATTETIDPAWFAGEPMENAEGWSLVCHFEPPVSEQGSPSSARVRFWMDHAPHERLRPGTVLRLFERGSRKLARVEILD
jgi:hypothetical protein